MHRVTTVRFILPHMCPKFSVSTVDCSHLGNHAGGTLSPHRTCPKIPSFHRRPFAPWQPCRAKPIQPDLATCRQISYPTTTQALLLHVSHKMGLQCNPTCFHLVFSVIASTRNGKSPREGSKQITVYSCVHE